jgi:hypothetical protein
MPSSVAAVHPTQSPYTVDAEVLYELAILSHQYVYVMMIQIASAARRNICADADSR